jgi:hypothetical protein
MHRPVAYQERRYPQVRCSLFPEQELTNGKVVPMPSMIAVPTLEVSAMEGYRYSVTYQARK